MQSYHVSLSRVNLDKDINDMHYYIILDVDDMEKAAEIALNRAKNDYPEGDISLVCSRENKPAKKPPVAPGLSFLLRKEEPVQ